MSLLGGGASSQKAVPPPPPAEVESPPLESGAVRHAPGVEGPRPLRSPCGRVGAPPVLVLQHYGDADLVLAVTWNKLPADAVPEVAPPTPGAPHVALAALRKAEDSSALCTAACEGDLPGLRGWLKAGVAPDAYWRGTPALLHACAASSEECARALLDAGAPVTALDTHGQTALHWACRMGHEGCTRLLLERGVDVAVRDWMGQTAQDVAAGKGHLAVARLVGAAEARRGPGGAESAAGPAEDGGGAAGRGMDYGAALVAQAEGHAAAEGRPRRFLDDDGHVIATEARDLAGLRIATAKHLRDD